MARALGIGARAARLFRRGRLPADVLGLAIASLRQIATQIRRRPQAHASPTIRRISAALAPFSRNARNAVARVDFDSFFPSASRSSGW
jgi:hypothetical protein